MYMTAEEWCDEQLGAIEEIRSRLDRLFYYAEEEDLKKRPHAKAWSVAEIIHHINLVNQHYLNQLPALDMVASATKDRELKPSWFGAKFQGMMSTKSKMRFKSPAKTDPIKRQAQGFATVEGVIFREILSDLEMMKKYIQALPEKSLEKVKLQSLVPLLKFRVPEALGVMLNHELRHLDQAERVLKQ